MLQWGCKMKSYNSFAIFFLRKKLTIKVETIQLTTRKIIVKDGRLLENFNLAAYGHYVPGYCPWWESASSDSIWWCARCLHFRDISDIRMHVIASTVYDCRCLALDAIGTHIPAHHYSDRTRSTAAMGRNGEFEISKIWFFFGKKSDRIVECGELTSLILAFFSSFCLVVADGCTTSTTTSCSSYARVLKSCVFASQSYVTPFAPSDSPLSFGAILLAINSEHRRLFWYKFLVIFVPRIVDKSVN